MSLPLETLSDSVLRAIDAVAGSSKEPITKLVADMLKSAVLKKYKVAFDQEKLTGKVHKRNVEGAIDFFFADVCTALRLSQDIAEETKENEIDQAQQQLETIKEVAIRLLRSHGLDVIE